jgi:predicted Co/Zn/Cd cation transporter (cation efflux family)
MAPEKNISTDVENIIFKIEKKYMLKESFLRVSKIRKTLWVELDFVVDNNSKIYSIQDQDLIRKEISQKIDSLKHETWLTVSFTLDRKWAL